MKKTIYSAAAALVLTAAMTVNAFAVQQGTVLRPGDTTIYTSADGTMRYATGTVQNIPGWMWVNGYCYYITDKTGFNKLTNCTTPDGYTVDGEGRWTVNGVPQYNGYGSLVVGTDSLYAGKDNDGIWAAMKDRLEHLYAENEHTDGESHAMLSRQNSVMSSSAYPWVHIVHNGLDGNFITAEMVSGWNDSPEIYSDKCNETIEQTYKLLMGDHVGQQFFNEVRAAADPCKAGGKAIKYDENGNVVLTTIQLIDLEGNPYYTEGVASIDTPSSTDGINWNLFDLSKWQGVKTDYGKTMTFELIPTDAGTQWYRLRIYIK